MKQEMTFEVGQRVITPEGEGQVLVVVDGLVKVKLDSGIVKIFPFDKVSDDSDAG